MSRFKDTIAAVSTPQGTGGVGIIRISGLEARTVCESIAGSIPAPRQAGLRSFKQSSGDVIDHGIVLYFPAPDSFTGEDVIEFQGHGGYVVMDMLLEAVLQAGARIARPGEFSERAFLNDRMDLVQAEAIADLIEAGTRGAARLAIRSLEGEFSKQIRSVADTLESIRVFVEAAIDFPEEEINFLENSDIDVQTHAAGELLSTIINQCDDGAVLRNGLNVVLCGAPNVGKSSLLNALVHKQRAIVSSIAGTTRDLVDERIQICNVPFNIVDTAGLRSHADEIEQEGIRRARGAMSQADLILCIEDDGEPSIPGAEYELPEHVPYFVIHNKIDLSGNTPGDHRGEDNEIWLSAKTGAGMQVLEERMLSIALKGNSEENLFLARRRHIDALEKARAHLQTASIQLSAGSGELMAEELKLAHRALGEITGEVTSDDLLGLIFSSFCIGK